MSVAKWIGVLVGVIALLTAGSTLALRVLNVESRDEAKAAREAVRTELHHELDATESRHQKHEESLRKIEADVIEVKTDVGWIKGALRDGGYRAPRK